MRLRTVVVDKSAQTQVEAHHIIPNAIVVEPQALVKQLAVCLQNLPLTTYHRRVVDNMCVQH